MTRGIQGAAGVGALTVLALLASLLFAHETHLAFGHLFAFLESLSLLLGAFVALTSTAVIRALRKAALISPALALAIPYALLAPYLIMAIGTQTFSLRALAKLVAYVTVPNLLLLPDREHGPERAGWRDFAAILALGLPVSANWLAGVWVWPQELYFFRPLFCVCVGAYAFLVVRNLQDVGYRLTFRARDAGEALVNFIAFAILAIPLGLALHFLHPHRDAPSLLTSALTFLVIYLTVAIPEELLFRGILQNFLCKTFQGEHRGRYGLIVASVVFGASHLHHPPVPNWRYGILATLAGLFYGNVFRNRRRTSASALTHALVDTVWRFWF